MEDVALLELGRVRTVREGLFEGVVGGCGGDGGGIDCFGGGGRHGWWVFVVWWREGGREGWSWMELVGGMKGDGGGRLLYEDGSDGPI